MKKTVLVGTPLLAIGFLLGRRTKRPPIHTAFKPVEARIEATAQSAEPEGWIRSNALLILAIIGIVVGLPALHLARSEVFAQLIAPWPGLLVFPGAAISALLGATLGSIFPPLNPAQWAPLNALKHRGWITALVVAALAIETGILWTFTTLLVGP